MIWLFRIWNGLLTGVGLLLAVTVLVALLWYILRSTRYWRDMWRDHVATMDALGELEACGIDMRGKALDEGVHELRLMWVDLKYPQEGAK